MGRLLEALRASTKGADACDSRESANPPPPAAPRFADSQDSQPRESVVLLPIRRFAGFAGGGRAAAEATLARIAEQHRINWRGARSQMIDGDAEAGAEQLAADEGDGVELASVIMWLRLLAGRAPPAEDPPHNGPGPGLDSYGRPLPKAREQVTCETCAHFIPDAINPEAGVGQCRAGVGEMSVGVSLHPMALRLCSGHQAATHGA